MGDLLRSGLGFLHAQRHLHMTTECLYMRRTMVDGPGEDPVPGWALTSVLATFDGTGYEQTDADGVMMKGRIRDFLIRAEDLGFEPSEYDRIRHDGREYEVSGEKCFEDSGSFKNTYRIHTVDLGIVGDE